ncbi:MAG: type IV secretion system protein [Cetobacterium sp.]
MDFVSIIEHFKVLNGQMIKNLSETSLNMIYYLIMIDISLTFLFIEDDGMNVFIKLVRKILVYGFFIYILKNYAEIVGYITDGFIQLGNLATAASTGTIPSKNLVVSPGAIFDDVSTFITLTLGMAGGTVALDAIPLVSIESIPTAVLSFCFLLALGAILIGIEIVIIFIKFFIVTGTAILLIPFGGFQKTQDIAMKGLHSLFAQGVELMFVTIMLNFYEKFKNNLFSFSPPSGTDINTLSMIQNLSIMLLFVLLITKIPTFVSTLLSGSISSLGMTSGASSSVGNRVTQGVKAGGQAVKSSINAYMNATKGE